MAMKKAWTFLVMALLIGCAGTVYDFYGVRIDYSQFDDAFKILAIEGDKVEHTQGKYFNTDVVAWGQLNGKTLIISFKNNSGDPISSDAFLDNFILILKSEERVQLVKQDAVMYRYHAPEQIMPNREAQFILTLPRLVDPQEIERIVCEIGVMSGVRLVLKPTFL